MEPAGVPGLANSSRIMTDPSATAAVKRACDACHRRKVKCLDGGARPCKNCTAAGLTCTYNAIPQKKGPKGSRAKVISELRETQRQTQLAGQRHGLDLDDDSATATCYRRPGLLSMDIITACVDYFFANLYPPQPISFSATSTSLQHHRNKHIVAKAFRNHPAENEKRCPSASCPRSSGKPSCAATCKKRWKTCRTIYRATMRCDSLVRLQNTRRLRTTD